MHLKSFLALYGLMIFWPLTLMADSCSSANNQRSLRIIGGENAKLGDYPWMVSINQARDNSLLCGGSLIHPSWVLTAAHCMDGPNKTTLLPSDIVVTVGLHQQQRLGKQGERVSVKRIIPHPQWKYAGDDNWPDLALLELATPSKQSPVSLITEEGPTTAPQQLATVLGWGYTSVDPPKIADTLQQLTIPITSLSECQKAYTGEEPILETMICAGLPEGGKDSCSGDSGGPLVVCDQDQWKQIGIVSYGGKQAGPICAGPNAYGVYTRITAFLDFINEYLPSAAEEIDYDGVWQSPDFPNTFFMLRSANQQLVIVLLNQAGREWYALFGTLQQPVTTLVDLISSVAMTAEFEITSPPEVPGLPLPATFTLTRCQSSPSSASCPLPVGTKILLNKIF